MSTASTSATGPNGQRSDRMQKAEELDQGQENVRAEYERGVRLYEHGRYVEAEASLMDALDLAGVAPEPALQLLLTSLRLCSPAVVAT
jgi:Flp pilus assembly protein TadD